jgi:hypothetical protein
VAFDVCSAGDSKLTGPETLYGFAYGTGDTDDHFHTRLPEDPERIGSAIAGQHMADASFRHHLGRLNPRPTTQGEVGILHRLELQGIGIDDEKVWTTSEPRFNRIVECRSRARYCDFHEDSFLTQRACPRRTGAAVIALGIAAACREGGKELSEVLTATVRADVVTHPGASLQELDLLPASLALVLKQRHSSLPMRRSGRTPEAVLPGTCSDSPG